MRAICGFIENIQITEAANNQRYVEHNMWNFGYDSYHKGSGKCEQNLNIHNQGTANIRRLVTTICSDEILYMR